MDGYMEFTGREIINETNIYKTYSVNKIFSKNVIVR